jgi:hypothetical protein
VSFVSLDFDGAQFHQSTGNSLHASDSGAAFIADAAADGLLSRSSVLSCFTGHSLRDTCECNAHFPSVAGCSHEWVIVSRMLLIFLTMTAKATCMLPFFPKLQEELDLLNLVHQFCCKMRRATDIILLSVVSSPASSIDLSSPLINHAFLGFQSLMHQQCE